MSNDARGRFGESLAFFYLLCKFYRPVARRYKTPVGEIDLIFRKQKTLVFIEVKSHKTLEQSLESVHSRQQGRIWNAARWYIASQRQAQSCTYRFDVVALNWNFRRFPSRLKIHHIKNAWQGTL